MSSQPRKLAYVPPRTAGEVAGRGVAKIGADSSRQCFKNGMGNIAARGSANWARFDMIVKVKVRWMLPTSAGPTGPALAAC